MAEDIGGICREYVQENAHRVSDKSEHEAVAELAHGAKGRLAQIGWDGDAAAFGVEVEGVVRDQLRKYRAQG